MSETIDIKLLPHNGLEGTAVLKVEKSDIISVSRSVSSFSVNFESGVARNVSEAEYSRIGKWLELFKKPEPQTINITVIDIFGKEISDYYQDVEYCEITKLLAPIDSEYCEVVFSNGVVARVTPIEFSRVVTWVNEQESKAQNLKLSDKCLERMQRKEQTINIGQIQSIKLEPGEVLAVQCPDTTTMQDFAEIKEIFREALGENVALVFCGDLKFTKIVVPEADPDQAAFDFDSMKHRCKT